MAYVHVEAPDEMGHQGSVERKIKAIENLDSRVIKVIKEVTQGLVPAPQNHKEFAGFNPFLILSILIG